MQKSEESRNYADRMELVCWNNDARGRNSNEQMVHIASVLLKSFLIFCFMSGPNKQVTSFLH